MIGLNANSNIETEELATIEDILNLPDSEPALELPQAPRIIDARIAFIMDSILKDVVRKGTGRKAHRAFKRNDMAGKTATTNGPTDGGFSGYAGGIVTTAWLGFDKNSILGSKEFGSSTSLPIWIDYMKTALQEVPQTAVKRPPGIVSVKIDPDTGQLAEPGQSNAIFEIFREEFAPTAVIDGESPGKDESRIEEIIAEDLF